MITASLLASSRSALRGFPKLSLSKDVSSSLRAFSAPSVGTAAANTLSMEQDKHVSLVQVPTLPFLGSLVPFHSGAPALDQSNIYAWFRTMNKKFGPFYSFGLPGIGEGLHGTIHVVRDPHEMLKVIKHEGTFPSGIGEREWPVVAWLKRHDMPLAFFTRPADMEWKRLRTFLQTDLLSPASAREYLPMLIEAARQSSAKAGETKEDPSKIMRYLNCCSLDMFTAVLFGTVNDGISKEDYNEFIRAGVDGLGEIFHIMRSPEQTFAHWMGFETPRLKRLFKDLDIVDDIARRRFRSFMEKGDNLTEREKMSYYAKALQRQKDSDVTDDELMHICVMMMHASVDTTATKIAWNILQLSLDQEFQERLYLQIKEAVDQEPEGVLTPAMFAKSQFPLLSAAIRETHRCTPTAFMTIIKTIASPMNVYGQSFPAGTAFGFDADTIPMDPDLVDDPWTFRPERWLPYQVEARKGTPSAIIDHPFFSGPFSQGARRCPGSRVAHLETQVMLAQLLLDYKIEGPLQPVHWKDLPNDMGAMPTPRYPEGVRFVPRA